MKKELVNSTAKKVFVSNIMNNPHESKGFRAIDSLKKIEEYLVEDIFDYIILPINNLHPEQVERYAKKE